MSAPLLPLHSDHYPLEEPVAEPLAAAGMLCLIGLLWLCAYLVLMPLVNGHMPGSVLRAPSGPGFSPLPVTTRLPMMMVAGEDERKKAQAPEAADEWGEAKHHAGYVAGALVEDEVEGVLLKLQLVAETGKLVGRFVKVNSF